MNILVIAPTPFYSNRGTPIRIFEQVKGQLFLGNTVTIATYPMGGNPDFGDTAPVITRVPKLFFWKNELSAGPHGIKIILDFLLFWVIIKQVIHTDVDIIHAHHHEGVFLGWLVKKVFFWKTIKLVGDFHSSFSKEMTSHGYGGNSFMGEVYKKIERWAYQLPDKCIASASTLCEYINECSPKVPCEWTPDVVDVNYQDPRMCVRDEVVLLYTGGFTPDKGIELFLKSLEDSELINHFQGRVIIAGSPLVHIEQRVASHPLRSRIEFIDNPSPKYLEELLDQAMIAIEPKESTLLQSSGKLIRYMAKGLPVVALDHSVNRAYLGDDYLLVSEYAAKAFAEKILLFVRDKGLRDHAAVAAYNRSQLFTAHSVGQSLNKLYQTLCQ